MHSSPMNNYQMCSRCVLDTSAPHITFDEAGVCNYCHHYDQVAKRHLTRGRHELDKITATIKTQRHGHKYDALLGISGGVDSSYVTYLAKHLGFRLLLVHLDNGWDDPLATKNIQRLLTYTGYDLYNYHVNTNEFHDLQIAYLRASVVDCEAPTDHAIHALLYRVADAFRIPYRLSGSNIVTETVIVKGWSYNYKDLRNLKSIHEHFGIMPLRTYPTLSFARWWMLTYLKGIKHIKPLNYLRYHRDDAIQEMRDAFGYQPYGQKHHESRYTRFYQQYILPVKFGIDKRRMHLSNLVCSGQLSRDEALRQLHIPVYSSEEARQHEKLLVLDQLGLSESMFDRLMATSPKPHTDYATNAGVTTWLRWIQRGVLYAKRLIRQ